MKPNNLSLRTVLGWAVLTAATAVPSHAAVFAQFNPADPSVSVPPAEYRSAFQGYLPDEEPRLARWKDANAEAERLGGHLGHAAPSGVARPVPGLPLPANTIKPAGPRPGMSGIDHGERK